jgi:hypothetical protein
MPSQKSKPKRRIVVLGDLAIDQIEIINERKVAYPESDLANDNWALRESSTIYYAPGASNHISELIENVGLPENTVIRGSNALPSAATEKIAFNIMEARYYPKSPIDDTPTLRLTRRDRFAWSSEVPAALANRVNVAIPSIESDDIVVINDTGNLFRKRRLGLERGKTNQNIIYVMHRALPWACNGTEILSGAHPLWSDLQQRRLLNKVILVLNLWDLRYAGLRVSRTLSWERTAQELLAELKNPPFEEVITQCAALVVRIGMEGALCVIGDPNIEKSAMLVYDPRYLESQLSLSMEGSLLGYTNVFPRLLRFASIARARRLS